MAWNDSLSTQRVGVLTLTLSDNTLNNWNDAITGMGRGLLCSETLVFNDALGLGIGLLTAENANNLADAALKTAGFRITFEDSISNWNDAVSFRVDEWGIFNDSLDFWADAQAKILSYEFSLIDSEAANWADTHQLLLSQRLALLDTANNWADSVSFILVPVALNISLSDDHFALEFGSTPVLDNFNRSDEGPPPSTSWGAKVLPDESGLVVVSNTCRSPSLIGTQSWGTSFGPDCEAYFTVPSGVTNQAFGVFLRLNDLDTDFDGYLVLADNNEGFAYVRRYDDGVPTELTFLSLSMSNGMQFGARIVGSLISVYSNQFGTWELIGEVEDSTYPDAGFIGLYVGSDTVVIDDFGGGGITPHFRDSLAYDLLEVDTTNLTLKLADTLSAITDSLVIGHGFIISENVFFTLDSINAGQGLSISDQLAFSDSIQLVLGQQLTFSESINNFNDSLAIGYGFRTSDALVLTDSINSGYGLIASEQLSQSDFLQVGFGFILVDNADNLLDSESHVLGLVYAFVENILFSNDSLNLGYGFVIVENVLFLDDSVNNDYGLTFSDTLFLSDTVQLRQELHLNLSDEITLADSISTVLGQHLTFSDTLSLTDELTKAVGIPSTFAETINNLNDNLARQLGIAFDLSDFFTLTDAKSIGYGLQITDDQNNWQESVATNAPQPAGLTLGLNDSINAWQDSLSLEQRIRLSLSDTSIQSDALMIGYGLSAEDTAANLNDSIGLTLVLSKDLSDLFTISDNAAFRLHHRFVFDDSFSLDDNSQQLLIYRLGNNDSIENWQDQIRVVVEQSLALDDSFSLTDDICLSYGQGLSDSFSINDSFEIQINHLVGFSDFLDSLSDIGEVALGHVIPVEDSINNWIDDFSTLSGANVLLNDSFSISDGFAASFNYFLEVSEQLLLFDELLVSRATPGGLELFDNLNNWNDGFKRKHRSVFGERTMRIDEDSRMTTIPSSEREVISGESRITIIERENRGG